MKATPNIVEARAIEAELDTIEADAGPCLQDAVCNCAVCERYCALWARLDEIIAEKEFP